MLEWTSNPPGSISPPTIAFGEFKIQDGCSTFQTPNSCRDCSATAGLAEKKNRHYLLVASQRTHNRRGFPFLIFVARKDTGGVRHAVSIAAHLDMAPEQLFVLGTRAGA